MRVRIIRPWQLREWPTAHLDLGQVFEVRCGLAIYWFALRCAEPVSDVSLEAV